MAGHGVEDDPNLKGLSRYFNSTTNRGRANTSKATCVAYSELPGSNPGGVNVNEYEHLKFIYDIDKSCCGSTSYERNYIRLIKNFIKMAGDSSADPNQLKGLSKYFNSKTDFGRANTAKATYAFFGALILYYTLKPKSKN
ncbi:unnamed protein product [Chilo suppressalis]|uniref:Uncharacterized protein n=1 Tax=Chilo suppressalis TaxID=168631 RepID=A0ABN8BG04_CHISP|nr:hypothetical protein evm_002098 [Chilo suppressalis]CAH0405792.1 unnamed protein product [Chilo suppressalis]